MIFILKLLAIPVLVFFYYNFFKKLMISFASYLVKKKKIESRECNLEELKSIIELVLIVVSHLVFCLSLAWFLKVPLFGLYATYKLSISSVLFGLLLGIGQMAFSATICFILINILQAMLPKTVPSTPQEWVTQSRAGWVRHHFHAFKRLPLILAMGLISLQISAEETVFRVIVFDYLKKISPVFSIVFSTLLFTIIQSFLMPRKISSMFPIVGALIMGFSNSIIYMQFPNIYPLIIGHIAFFFFSMI